MKEIKFDRMVRYYREQNGLTQKQLARIMGKTESAVSRWESGENSPKIEDLNLLAKTLGVDVDTLVFGGEIESSGNQIIDKTVNTMKELSVSRQENVYDYAKQHLKKQNEGIEYEKNSMDLFKLAEETPEYIAKRNPNVRYIREYIQGLASAGSGEWQEDDLNIEVWIPEDEVPDKYDSIAKVMGNSMLPRLRNEDLLFVQFNKPVEVDQIGIFKVNGDGNFVKRLRQDSNGIYYLESLNPKYDDIHFEEGDELVTIGAIVGVYRK